MNASSLPSLPPHSLCPLLLASHFSSLSLCLVSLIEEALPPLLAPSHPGQEAELVSLLGQIILIAIKSSTYFLSP